MCSIMECIQEVSGNEVHMRFADTTRTREDRDIHSMKNKKRRKKKSVSFSQTSEVQEYHSLDELYDKSYSIVERKRFKRGTLMEAIRIRRRILLFRNESSPSTSSYPPPSTSDITNAGMDLDLQHHHRHSPRARPPASSSLLTCHST